MEVSIVFISLFIAIFGICYLYFNTRHKERLALIEKDKDVSVFYSKKEKSASPVWRIVILNLSLVSIGVGLGILLGAILNSVVGLQDEVAFPSSIFLLSGVGLLTGFFLARKSEEKSKV